MGRPRSIPPPRRVNLYSKTQKGLCHHDEEKIPRRVSCTVKKINQPFTAAKDAETKAAYLSNSSDHDVKTDFHLASERMTPSRLCSVFRKRSEIRDHTLNFVFLDNELLHLRHVNNPQ